MAVLKDVVYGAAIGDALGVPYEFRARGSFTCEGMASGGFHGQPAGTFSDDTSMMLATCDSIRELGRIDCDDIRKRFCRWAYEGEYASDGIVFDIGSATSTALVEGVGRSGIRSNGNGSLMRIAPLAFAGASYDEIRAVSAITHAHEISTESCVTYVRVLGEILMGKTVAEATADARVAAADYAFSSSIPIDEVKSGGYVVNTLDAALWCLCNTSSYSECVLTAVNLGGDTDTTGCVVGALAGAVYGIDSIPKGWIEVLRGKDVIDACLF